MNDLTKHATFYLAEGEIAPLDVGFQLNEIPMSALASTGSPYGIPEKMFKSLASNIG